MHRLILIGSRAAGKTSVGRLVAASRSVPFADLDDRAIALAGGGSIAVFFEMHGEAAWRSLERRAFAAALDGGLDRSPDSIEPARVIALGGGAVTVPEIRDGLEAGRRDGSLRVAWLSAPVATLSARLEADPGDRRSLTGRGVAEETGDLLARREPLYRRLADREFPTADRPVATVAAEIGAWLDAIAFPLS